MTTRISKKIIARVGAAQFEDAMSQYATASIRETDILAQMDAEIAMIKDKYSEDLDKLKEKKRTTLEIIETYCREQKNTLFSKRRTMLTRYGSVGFRLGNPKLIIKNGNDWKQVVARLKVLLPNYVRVTEEPAKDMILADRSKATVAPLLKNIGLQVVQDELLFVELTKMVA